MLDVHRRPNIDSGLEQLLDVLPALRMTRSRFAAHEIRVRELVDEQNRRSARKRGVESKFPADDPAILDRERRDRLEAFHEALGLDAAVRLDVADHRLDTGGLGGACGREHREGLPYARGRSKED